MITIPSGVFDIYKEAVDEMITKLGINCTLVYPGRLTQCINCNYNALAGRSTNTYKTGGPMPFSVGICPLCGGEGSIKEEETTETIQLRVYWTPKEWKQIGIPINVPDADVITMGYLSDYPKIKAANFIVINSDQEAYAHWRFEKSGEGYPHGFLKDRYIATLWKRIG